MDGVARIRSLLRRSRSAPVIGIAAGAVFVLLLAWAWVDTIYRSVTCTLGSLQPGTPLRYIELRFKDYHPTEPEFGSEVFLLEGKSEHQTLSEVKLTRTGAQGYLPSAITVPLVFDQESGELVARKAQPWSFVPVRGRHWYFPFDSAYFDTQITIEPLLSLTAFRLTNRVPGFVCDCADIMVRQAMDGKWQIQFELRRNSLVQLAAAVLAGGALVFLVFILQLPNVESLAPAVASYFFSLWSIRNILGGSIRVFPTLLDCWLLTLSTLLIVGLVARLLVASRGSTYDEVD